MSARTQRRASAIALALTLMTATPGCGDDGEPRQAAPTATTLAASSFADAVRAGDLDSIQATLAEDVELHSPVLADPFVGSDRVGRLFAVLLDTFEDVEIRDEIEAPGRFVLSFDARVDGQPIHIVDVLQFDDDGHIATLVVTSRPLAGTEALATAVAPHLPEIG